MSSIPQQSMQEIYNDVAALMNDYKSLQADIANNNYSNITVIQTDIEAQQNNLEKLMENLVTYQNKLPVGSNAYQALSQVTNNLFECIQQLTVVVSDINNPGKNAANLTNALAALANQGGPDAGVIYLAVDAYRNTLNWSAAVVQDAISSGASSSVIQTDLEAFQSILNSESPSNMAGALGISQATFASLMTAVSQAISNAGDPKALQSNWSTILGILDQMTTLPPKVP